MEDIIARFFANLTERPSGPMAFRFLLQPTMASLFAIKAGLQDARTGQPAYFWAMLGDRHRRRDLLRQWWKDMAKVFTLALVLDLVYQVVQLKWIYPLEAIVVAFTLAFLPYLLLRGPVNRLARWWRSE
jgi:hypothetical protein